MSRNNDKSFDVSWGQTSKGYHSLHDATSVSPSRNSLSSSSSQSDDLIPPPPPDSDDSDCSLDCSITSGDSHTGDRSEDFAFSASKSKRSYVENCCKNVLFQRENSSSCLRAHNCSVILDSSTTKSSIQSYPLDNRTEEDVCGKCELDNSEWESSSECTPPGWRPRKSFINTHASGVNETCRSIIRGRLFSLMRVARMFALRCGFDHWKCAGAKNSKHSTTKRLPLGKLLVSSELSRKSFGMLEHAVIKATRRSAFCVLRYRTEQRKHSRTAFHVLSKVFFGAQLRAAFRGWVDKQRRFLSKYSALNILITKAQIKRVKHCFLSWRSRYENKLRKKQACFLMMVFNRWRIHAEESMAETQKKHDALIHWATALCSKAFDILRKNAQQNKLRIRRTSYSCPNRYLTPSTHAISRGKPFSLPYRSPDSSMTLKRTPDAFSHLSATQSASQLFRGYSYVGDGEDASPFASWFDLQESHVRPSRANDVIDDHLKTFGRSRNTFLTPRRSLSRRADTVVHSRLFGNDGMETKVGNPHPNTSFRSKYTPLAATQTEMTKTQCSTLFSTDHRLDPMPSHSVRVMRSLYKDRYEIATILDEMVTRIEESRMWH